MNISVGAQNVIPTLPHQPHVHNDATTNASIKTHPIVRFGFGFRLGFRRRRTT